MRQTIHLSAVTETPLLLKDMFREVALTPRSRGKQSLSREESS
jgi:hypothetical protein